jgi:DEAD/DEAH box helicase domain-containing protein
VNNIVYFDLETQKSADEVGGWNRKRDMLMSVGVTYASADGQYRIFTEAQVNELIQQLMRADLLMHYTPLDLRQVPTLDLMKDLESKLGHRLSLESLAVPTLGAPKVADGMAALKWWKEGKLMQIAEYCCYDVKITKQLHEYGKANGQVFYQDRFGQKRSVKVKW